MIGEKEGEEGENREREKNKKGEIETQESPGEEKMR